MQKAVAMNVKRKRPTNAKKSERSSRRFDKTNLDARPTSRKAQVKATGQVRIIGGQFRRQWVPFIDAEGLRPSPDRLRETLFNWIQFDINDANVLDLCAGSGVLGFESLSRGATWVDFIELQSHQAALILETAAKLNLSTSQFRVSTGDALGIIPTLTTNHSLRDNYQPFYYHIVYIDPPYDLSLWVPLIHLLIEHRLVDSKTLFYIEDRRELDLTLHSLAYDFTLVKSSKIGQIFASLIQIDFK